MSWVVDEAAVRVWSGDCLDALRELPDDSVDAIVTDPPYGLTDLPMSKVTKALQAWMDGDREHVPSGRGMMGRDWDRFVPPPAVWDECLRVLKPGGHLAAFAGSRTVDLMGMSIRLAGFTLKDTLGYIYGSGMPKGQDVETALRRTDPSNVNKGVGYHTQLKPAIEPIVLAFKPISENTVAKNVVKHGTGALHTAACRVGDAQRVNPPGSTNPRVAMGDGWRTDAQPTLAVGRFPANVILDEDAAQDMDRQSGNRPSGKGGIKNCGNKTVYGSDNRIGQPVLGYGDEGGASRFFYCAKASKSERPKYIDSDGVEVQHISVKPLSLMRWLSKLLCPPGGTILDPFAGSGTTVEAAMLEGFPVIVCEGHEPYLPLIEQRIARARDMVSEKAPELDVC